MGGQHTVEVPRGLMDAPRWEGGMWGRKRGKEPKMVRVKGGVTVPGNDLQKRWMAGVVRCSALGWPPGGGSGE